MQTKAEVHQKLVDAGVNSPIHDGQTRFPHIYFIEVLGADAFKTWQKLRVASGTTGFWPVIWLSKDAAFHQNRVIAESFQPLDMTLRDFGIVQRHPIDIPDLKKRIATRPASKFHSLPPGEITTQEQASRIDALLRLQDLHLKELATSGVLPGVMPTDMNRIRNTMTINQRFVPIIMRLTEAPIQHRSSKAHSTGFGILTVEQLATICKQGKELNFEQWLSTTEKSSSYHQVKTGRFVGATGQNGSRAAYEYEYKESQYIPLHSVIMLLVPTAYGWQVPAHLAFGDINANPAPAVHVAAMKRWHERYGAELVALQDDRAEFYVILPPKTPEAAMTLAREQFIYCPDLIKPEDQTLGVLAGKLINSHFWNFWWD